MAADPGKFLSIDDVTGLNEEVQAVNSSAGVADAGKIIRTNAAGQIDATFIPASGTVSIEASETISAGDVVEVFDDAGTPKVRLADRSNGRQADGYVLAGGVATDILTVYFEGVITGLVGLTIGARYFLSTTGDVETTPTTASGELLQFVGKAISATSIAFEPELPRVRA